MATPYRPGALASFDLDDLSPDEKTQLSEIILTVTEAPDERTAIARQAIRTILRRHGALPEASRRELEARFLKIGQGPRLFWLDARQAVADGRPVKSAARLQWEAELLGDGWLTMAQQRRYDDFMDKLSRGEPIESTHGMDVIVDEAIAKTIVDSLGPAELQATVASLLTPP